MHVIQSLRLTEVRLNEYVNLYSAQLEKTLEIMIGLYTLNIVLTDTQYR